jgi:hypothetical protein
MNRNSYECEIIEKSVGDGEIMAYGVMKWRKSAAGVMNGVKAIMEKREGVKMKWRNIGEASMAKYQRINMAISGGARKKTAGMAKSMKENQLMLKSEMK